MNLLYEFSSKSNLRQAFDYIKQELLDSTLPLDQLNSHVLQAAKTLGQQLLSAISALLRSGKIHF